LRGSLAAKTRDALFSIFGEATLPLINTNAGPTEISEWKRRREVADCYKRLTTESNSLKKEQLTTLTGIIQRVFKSEYSDVEVAFVIAVCTFILNPKCDKLKLSEKTIKRKVKVYMVSFITFFGIQN
jgi:hypothetical protein